MTKVIAPPPPQMAWQLQPGVKCLLSSWCQYPAILQSHPLLLAARILLSGRATLPHSSGLTGLWPKLEGVSGLFLMGDATTLSPPGQQGQMLQAGSHQKPLSAERTGGQASSSCRSPEKGSTLSRRSSRAETPQQLYPRGPLCQPENESGAGDRKWGARASTWIPSFPEESGDPLTSQPGQNLPSLPCL